ncbi:MAG: hypothetical protein WBO19_07865, partial [Terriglobia bacterium]
LTACFQEPTTLSGTPPPEVGDWSECDTAAIHVPLIVTAYRSLTQLPRGFYGQTQSWTVEISHIAV